MASDNVANKFRIQFHSQPLVSYKKIDQKEKLLYPKLISLCVLQMVLGAWMIAFICVGFQAKYNQLPIQQVPEWVATFRSVSIFLMAWYVVVSAFLLHNGIQEIKHKNYVAGVLNALAFFLVPAIMAFGWMLSQTSWTNFKNWFISLFETDPELKQHYNRKNWKYLMMCGVLIVMTPLISFVFYRDGHGSAVYSQNGTEQAGIYANLWYDSLQYFTIQTNTFCYLLVILFVICPSWKIFRSHSYLMYAVSYLLIVGVTYDFILFPSNVASGVTAKWKPYEWATNVWEHVVDPIVFCTSGIILLSQSRQFQSRDYLTTLKYGMIIPSVYLTYALTNSFAVNESVYGWFTNCNPNLWNCVAGTSSFPEHGEPYFCLFIILYWAVFVGVITGFWSLDQYAYLKTMRKQEQAQTVASK